MTPVPDPPVRDPRTVRYSTRFVRRAQELMDAEWTTGETARRLALEFELDKPPARTTIRRWTEPGYIDLHRAWQTKCQRQAGRPGRFLADDVLLALREDDGLSYAAIAKVVHRFYGVEMSPEVVRFRLYRLGVAKNPNKVRANEARCAA